MKTLLFIFLLIVGFTYSPIAHGQSSDNMNLLGSWDDPSLNTGWGVKYNDVWGYSADGREYAILGALEYTIFLDVTEPNDPREIARFAGGAPSIWRDFKTFRTYAYGVADQTSSSSPSGLQIFDLSELPNKVTKVRDSNVFFETAHNIFIDTLKGYLYVAGSNTRPNGLLVLKLMGQETKPTVAADVILPGGYVHDVFVRDLKAYCSHGNNGLYIYDMTFPQNPEVLGALPFYSGQGYNHSSWLTDAGDALIFADENHGQPLRILDVSDFSNLSVISTFSSSLLAPAVTNSIPHNPFVRDNLAFISYYHEGIQVFDISDRLNPTRAAYYDTYSNSNYFGYEGAWGVYPFLPSNIVLGSDISNGLFLLELKEGAFPENVDTKNPFEDGTEFTTALSDFETENLSISIFPNPILDGSSLHLSIESKEHNRLYISILDLSGRRLQSTEQQTIAGKQEIELTVSGISSGTYLLEVKSKDHAVRKPFVINR